MADSMRLPRFIGRDSQLAGYVVVMVTYMSVS